VALRDINLVPGDFLFRQNLSRHLGLWGLVLIFALASILTFHFYQINRAHSKRPPAEFMKDAPEQLSFKIEEIKRVQGELIRLDQQKSDLENITRNPDYSRVLVKLVNIMNDNTWITQLTIENNKEDKTEFHMSLLGYAKNSAELGDFIGKLAETPIFYDVFLNYANKAMITESEYQVNDSSNLIEFQLECGIRG
jgi:hypothetical protein